MEFKVKHALRSNAQFYFQNCIYCIKFKILKEKAELCKLFEYEY